MNLTGYVVILISGVLFPTGLLPAWLRHIGDLIPLTHALEGMRLALLQGQTLAQLSPIVLKLIAFAAVLQTVGLLGFNVAVNWTKSAGSLAEY